MEPPPPPPHPEDYTRDLLARALPLMKDPDVIEAVSSYLVSGSISRYDPTSYPNVYYHNSGTPADWWGMSVLCWPALSCANNDPWADLEDYITILSTHDRPGTQNP